ncbi:hypothetical protein [Nostoc sp. NMS4]|uniref:hypothetical protein n=1 Tax=Nostoc sp. NMS4 TaxID=2815390 RepID=UPI0025EAD1EC|nr:hypothetical protein [Nostoc sp. NMS4]MBN3923003.1 hypothetical protein [Nostoc sp. NMS4]
MKERSIRIRLSQKRNDKLKAYAQSKEKTVTQLVEDWIDRLPSPRIDDFDALLRDAKSVACFSERVRGLANATLSTNPLPNQSDD